MTTDEQSVIIDRSKSKKDGVYSYRGIIYAVNDNHFIAFSDYYGCIYQCFGMFNVQTCTVKSYDRIKTLKNILKHTI